MERLLEILFGWWWYGRDGRTKTADVADKFVFPFVAITVVACLVALLVWATR